LKREDSILDYTAERTETLFGNGTATYLVSKKDDGTLKIRLDHSNKKFYRLSAITLIVGTLALTFFCLSQKFLSYFAFSACLSFYSV